MNNSKDLERLANAIKQGKTYHLFSRGFYLASFFTTSCARTVSKVMGAKVVYLTNH